MDDAVEVTFRFTAADAAAIQRVATRRRQAARGGVDDNFAVRIYVALFSVGATLFAAWLGAINSNGAAALIPVFCAATYFSARYFVEPALAGRATSSMTRSDLEAFCAPQYRARFDEERVSLRSEDVVLEVRWRRVKDVTAADGIITVLPVASSSGLYVPQRAFSDADLAALRSLVRRVLGGSAIANVF